MNRYALAAALVALSAPAYAQQATPLGGLPSATSVNPTDTVPITQGYTGPGTGVTRKATVQQLGLGASGNVSNATSIATGSTTARTLGNRAADIVNVKDFGATGNTATLNSCTIAANSAALTCSAASFTSADVGKYFYLQGAGASGVPLTGTIASYTDATHVGLSVTASTATPNWGVWNPYAGGQVTVVAAGTGYVPGDTVTLAGGTGTASAVVTISDTQVVAATVNAGGSGGTNGACTVTGTTGTGSKFTASGTVTGGALGGALTIASAGDYTVNPSSLSAEPVTGCNLTGATVTLTMGALAVSHTTTPGTYTSPPASPASQASTSGTGTGATFKFSAYQVGGRFIYGTDDAAAVSSAIAAGGGKTVYFPAGSYWLASQSSTITIPANTILKGDGMGGYNVFTNTGATLLISYSGAAAFAPSNGMTWDGLGVLYPTQDNTQATPVAFPPLFEGNLINSSITNSRIQNAYQLVKVDATASLGRMTLDNDRIYCIDKCFYLLNGIADVLVVGPRNYFGPGAYDNVAVYGPANLGRYTTTSGEFIRTDVSGGNYGNVDGLVFNGFLVQGMRYVIRHLSGLIDVSTISNVELDNTLTALSVEGTAKINSTVWDGGEMYATDIYDLSQNTAIFNFTSTNQTSELNITGIQVSYALGSVVNDTGGSLLTLNFASNKLTNYGRSTTTGSYGGVMVQTGVGTHNIVANKFDCNRFGSSNFYGGLVTSNGGGGLFANNQVNQCTFALVAQGSGARFGVVGNSSTNGASTSLTESLSGTSVLTVGANSFDHGMNLRAPTVSACGTGCAIGSGSSWQRGTVTMGTGGVTAATVTFPAALPTTPVCTVSTGTAAIAAAVTSVSTSALTMGFSADLSSGTASYICTP